MDPLEQLRARIAGFPGYDGDLERRRSDEFVRSYLGEALADLEVRCGSIAPELKQRIDALLLRVGFADQKSFSIHHDIAGMHAAAGADSSVAGADAAAVDVADQALFVEPDAARGLPRRGRRDARPPRRGDACRRSNQRVTALGGRACAGSGTAAPRASTRADRKPALPADRYDHSPLDLMPDSMPPRASKSTSAGARSESGGSSRRRRATRRFRWSATRSLPPQAYG